MARNHNSRKRVDLKTKRIVIVAKENPRNAGTKAAKRYASLQKAMRGKRKATAREVMKASGYRGDDLKWDIERGNIKLVAA